MAFRCIVFFVLLFSQFCVLAQKTRNGGGRPTDAGSGGQDTTRNKMLTSRYERDSVGLFSYNSLLPDVFVPMADTLQQDFHRFDAAKKHFLPHFNLGFVGTPARPWRFDVATQPGFDWGYHAYDLQALSPDSLRFFKLQRPYSELNYSQGTRQSDAQLHALLARNLANDVSFVIDYKRVTNLSAPNLNVLDFSYNQPGNTNRALHVGFSWSPANKRYRGFYSYLGNTFARQETGGLRSDTALLQGQKLILGEASVFLNAAGARQEQRFFLGTHYLNLVGKEKQRANLVLRGRQKYGFFRQRFSDTAPDSTYYSTLYLKDKRGLRHYLEGYQYTNAAELQFNYGSDSSRSAYKLRVGAQHDFYRLQFDAADSSLSNLFLLADIEIMPLPNWQLLVDAKLNVAFDNIGDYKLHAKLSGKVLQQIDIEAFAQSQLVAPSLVEQRATLSQRELWRNSFSPTLHNQVGANVTIPRLNFQISGAYHLLNKSIVWDAAAQPQQVQVPISVLQFWGQQTLQFKGLGWQNRAGWQVSSEPTLLRVSPFILQSNLYGEWNMFKKVMRVRSGVELQYTSTWRGMAWQPVVGQFYASLGQNLDAYPVVDVYISIWHAQQFRFFAVYSHVFPWVERQINYPTTGFPQPDRYLRFGVFKSLRY